MWRRRAWFVTAAVTAVWIGCSSSSSTDTGSDGGADASGDGALGADANPSDCPATQPSMGDSCNGAFSCNYGCESCTCLGDKWLCSTPGCSGVKPCPATAPSNGDSCATSGGCCASTQESPCTYDDAGTTTTATCTETVWTVTNAPVDAGSDSD